MYRNADSGDMLMSAFFGFIALMVAIATIAWNIFYYLIFGLWLIARSLTEVIFEYIDEHFNMILSRKDGWYIAASGLFWAIIFPFMYGWLVAIADRPTYVYEWIASVALGVVWGITLGLDLVSEQWMKTSRQLENMARQTELSELEPSFYINAPQIRAHEDNQTLPMEEARRRLLGEFPEDDTEESKIASVEAGVNGDKPSD